MLENVQRRATKLVREVSRRIRGDMILTYKLISGKEGIGPEKFFKMATVRGDPEIAWGKKIYREHSKLNKRKYFFSQRAPVKWNNLTKKEVEAPSTSVFKKEFDLAEPSRMGAMYTGNHS